MKFRLLISCLSMGLCAHAQTITTIAGTGFGGFTSDGIPATSSGVFRPYDVGMDSLGNIYVGDVGNNRIRKIDTFGIIHTIAGTGTAGYNGDAIPATTAHLNFPYGMAVNQMGHVVISDMDNNRIRLIQSAESGGLIYTIAGTGVAGYSGDGGPASLAKVNNPQGIFWDAIGNVYFADAWNHRVRKISAAGTITTIAGNGTATSFGDGGPATAAGVNHPSGLSVDTAGNIYIAEMMGHRIRKVSPSGIITTIAGTGTLGFAGDGGPATAANIRYPKGVCVDRAGNIFFADTDNQVIRQVIAATGTITTIAGAPGIAAYGGDGGPASAAKFNFLQALFLDKKGNLYIGDCVNNRVRKIKCEAPVVSFISGVDTVCVGGTITLSCATIGGAWTTTSGRSGVSAAGVVSGITSGVDTVRYSVANSCATTTVTRAIFVKNCTVNVTDPKTAMAAIRPNPAGNELFITSPVPVRTLVITDISGRVVYQHTPGTYADSINISSLRAGNYFISINDQQAIKFEKL